MVTCTSILVPTDFSETSLVALDYGRALADRCWSTLHVVSHVVAVGGAAFWGFSDSDVGSRLEEEARHQFEALLPTLDGLQASVVTRFGYPSVEIVRYARDRNVDLIVMGTHGRGLLARLLIGGVVESVARRAPCPVLAVHTQSNSASGLDVTPDGANGRRRSSPTSTLVAWAQSIGAGPPGRRAVDGRESARKPDHAARAPRGLGLRGRLASPLDAFS